MHFGQIAIELFFGFIALFVITRILGKTQITQITTFDFISALVLGELVGNAVFDDQVSIADIFYAVFIWGILIFILEMITQKWSRTRGFLEGRPTIIIREGQILRDSLKKCKLDINQLQHLIRSKGVFSIRELDYAVLETDGTVSILKKAEYENPTKSDLQVNLEKVYIPITIISDGKVLKENLIEAGFNYTWLEQQLRQQNIFRTEEVLYAEWLEGKGLHVQSF
ncbi:YetF domain-containing protein [Metabacillus halosaccharovorans]